MTVCLSGIVRNEQDVIERCVRSALPHIDTYCIVDTGSTDSTVSIIKQVMDDSGVLGNVHHRDWSGFAHARTEALALSRPLADYVLTLDADMTVEGHLGELTHDAYFISIGQGFTWRLPLLTSTRIDWRYQGVTHSYLACDGTYAGANLDTLVITHHIEGRPRHEKIRNDITLLTDYLADHPDDPRSVYYIAQSHKDLGEYARAAEMYGKRADLNGWDEERFHARYREGQMCLWSGQEKRGVWALLEAWAQRPTRAEPLRSLAEHYRRRGNTAVADLFDQQADSISMTTDRLFVETIAYRTPMDDTDLQPEAVPQLDLPADDGWMLPPDMYGYLAALVRSQQPALLVECGSGASTVLLAALQTEHGGRVVSLEHEEQYVERTKRMLKDNSLSADVHHCPLGQAEQWQWYTDLPDLGEIGMLVVDGPPARTARLARYPALPLLRDHLADDAVIVLDDTGRGDEREIVGRWIKEHNLRPERIKHSKGEATMFRLT